MMLHSILFIDWQILERHFNSLCNALPDNYQLFIAKMKSKLLLLKDEGQQLNKMISSSDDARKINEKIIIFLVVKLCYSGSRSGLVRLCDVINKLIQSTDSTSCVQPIEYGMFTYV